MNKKKIIVSLIGLFCTYRAFVAISGVSGGIAAIAGLIIGLVWIVFAALCFYNVFGSKIGMLLGSAFYMPLQYLKKAPEKIAPVKGLIEQQKYPEAIAALNEILARKAFDPAPYLLLVEVYMDRLNDKSQTAELIEKYFRNPKFKAAPENVEMLMRYSDICLEQNTPEPAIALFELQLNAKGYSAPERRGLRLRLEALIAEKG
ncbi:MAG: hypothetical protein WCI51_15065 [Lentisphaerota bacterium]